MLKRSLLLVLLLSLFSVSIVAAQDDDEETFPFPVLESGSAISDELPVDAGGRLYMFTAAEGDSVTITMLPGAESIVDPYLVLLNIDGAVLAVDDDGAADVAAFAARIRNFAIPDDNVYFVIATDYGLINQQPESYEDTDIDIDLSYEISLQGATSLDDFELTRDFTIDLEDSAVVDITADAPVAYLSFVATEGDTFDIYTETEVDTLLMVFDEDGYRIALDDDSGDDFNAVIVGFEVPADGLYLVLVTTWDYVNALESSWDETGSVLVGID